MASAMDDEADQGVKEIEAEDCREQDSSNDEEMYAESSNSSLINNDFGLEASSSRRKPALIDDDVDGDASSDVTDILPQSHLTVPPDENSLLNMSAEEQIFYENFKDGNQDLLKSLKCTTCSNQLFLVNHENIRFHPVLGVLVCKPCREFYSTGPFTKDSNGQDEYCRWCAQGGTVICCDHCSNVFCKSCLRRYLGRATLMEINTGTCPWSCLVCNISPIWAQRSLSRMVLCDIQQRSAKPVPATVDTDSDDPAVWLPAIISEAENIASYCKSFTTKASRWLKNPNITVNGQDYTEKARVTEICRKLRTAANVTRMNMKKLDKAIVSRYSHSYGSAVDLDNRSKTSAASKTSSSTASALSPRSDSRVILKIKNYRKETDREEGYYAEIRASPLRSDKKEENVTTSKEGSTRDNHVDQKTDSMQKDSSNSVLLHPTSESVEETSQAELPLVHLEDNEETQQVANDSNDKEVEAHTEDSNKPRSVAMNPHSSGTKESEATAPATPTKLESTPVKESAAIEEEPIPSTSKHSKLKLKKPMVSIPIDANKKAKDLLLDTSESDDSIGDFSLSPRAKKTPKRNRPAFLGLDDPKLKAECAVVIERINNPEDALAIEKERNLGIDKLGQKINRLIKSPLYSTKKSKPEDESDSDASGDEKVSEKTKVSKKKVTPRDLHEDLNEDSHSEMGMISDNESASVVDALETFPPLRSTPKKSTSFNSNELARQQLLCSASSESEGEEGEIEVAQEPQPELVKNVAEKAAALKSSPQHVSVSDVEMNIVTDEDTSSKETNAKSSKLLRMSLGDPLAAKESSKTPKGKTEKKVIKKKRRIDSESESATSDSDFESKKKKKKRPAASANESSSDTEADSKPKSKRRRRIKKTTSSEEESSDSDVQVLNESQRSEANGSKGRKNIKKIIKDQNLKDETKKAAIEEEERKKRIADRQKKYNDVFVGDLALSNAQIDHLVLDFDPKTKEELVSVDQHLVKKLKPHQVKGVKFMWDACFESIERMKEHPGSGCILAHCMGLGKSLQVVTLVHTVLASKNCSVERVLVVCPLSTVLNWVNEFSIWLPGELELEVYELTSAKSVEARTYSLNHWFENGGVLIIGYEMYRNFTNDNSKNKKISKKAKEIFHRALVDPGPDLVICDEGHLLKNELTAISKSMNLIRTKRRIVLTGTPLQNSLIEYHCMIQFVKPNLLGNKKEFTNRFANPIKNGQAADSTDADVRVMKRRAHVLHKMLADSVQRFDYSVLTPFLPPKHEYVVSVKMSDLQIQLYQHYLEYHAKGGPGNIGRGKGAGLFADFQELGRIWTHPRAMQMSQIRRETKALNQSDSEGSLKDFIVDSDENDDAVVCLDESGGEEKDSDNDEAQGIAWKTRTRAGRGDQPPPQDELGVTATASGSWWSQFVKDEDMTKIEHSGKLVLLMDILRQCELIGDKVLVFSQSLFSLELIEEFLAEENLRNEANRATLKSGLGEEKVDPVGSWIVNCDYFRLDGQSSADNRKNWCNAFNNPNNMRSRLFLISTKAGGLGINLVAANRVIIFDASWNPSHDVQSIFRVFRFGQKKPCYIYRFLAQGTMEEKIYDRQVTKLSLSCRVVDEQQIERHFNSADLNELYVFEPDSHLRRPTPLLPKDRLLAELTIQRKEWIVTYHEHDSLLENKAEEELTELERKAAWDDFENEKRGISNNAFMQETPGLSFLPFGDIMSGLAGRSVAGIPLSNIAAMIYNSNPGITQDEFLGRLRLTVDQLQNFSVQQAAAANQAAVAAASVQNQLQQPAHTQQLLMQRQVAQESLMKRQFSASSQLGNAGPSGLAASSSAAAVAPPRSRGRPTIGPHQRTDLYGLPNSIYNLNTTQPAGPSTADKNT